MEKLKIIAYTHKTVEVNNLSKFHLDSDLLCKKLQEIKQVLNIKELMVLSTCNRYEFILSVQEHINDSFLTDFFSIYFSNNPTNTKWAKENVTVMQGDDALVHLFSVASSIDSLVVGEREIITQVRNSYEHYHKEKLTGDLIRMVIAKTIETAKDVYTQTNIAKKPVSVVSLAYRKLKSLNVKLDAKFLIIGSGATNTSMCRYLKKHGFNNFTVFNRTLLNAEVLAAEINGKALPLSELQKHTDGFDVIVSCTSSQTPVITKEIYTTIIANDKSKKIIIDLAIPNDLDAAILSDFEINLIAINNLQEIANENLKEREKELALCEEIIHNKVKEFKSMIREREVELAMKIIPEKVKEINKVAVNEVFAKEIEGMDKNSKEVLEKVIAYLEKKYISVPMKMAKEILIDKVSAK